MSHEIKFVIFFFGIAEILSLISFPIAFIVFRNFKDRGFAFSKTISLIVFAYFNLFFWFCGLGEHIIRDLFSFALVITVSIIITRKHLKDLTSFIKLKFKTLITIEGSFLLFALIALLIKTGAPDILTKSDKFLDFSIYNRLMVEESFPPLSSWLSGHILNYHWVGHYIFAALTRLAHTPPEYGINLSVILILSIIFVSALSIGYNLLDSLFAGFCSALGISLLSHPGGLKKLIQNSSNTDWSSILILKEGTINEFPYFAFLIGDLHSQFTALPVLLFVLACALNLYKKREGDPFNALSFGGQSLTFFFSISIALGLILTSNVFDYPTALLCIAAPIYYVALNQTGTALKNLIKGTLIFAALALTSLIALSPILYIYEAPSYAIKLLPLEYTSDPQYFFTVFGFPLFFIGIYLKYSFSRIQTSKKDFALFFILAVLTFSLALWRPRTVTIILFVLLGVSFYLFLFKRRNDPILLIVIIILFLTLTSELIYLDDLFRGQFTRMNTVFKLHWTALSFGLLISPIIAIRLYLKSENRLPKILIISTTLLFFITCSIFTIFGTKQMNFSSNKKAKLSKPTLNGFRYLKSYYPDEFEAVQWLRKRSGTDDILLETAGKPYTFHARFATFTGRPSVLGWGVHERMFRPRTYAYEIKTRKKNIDIIYSSKNKKEILPLLRKYKIKYIVVGVLEDLKYSSDSLHQFDKTFVKVFRKGRVTIYKNALRTGDNQP